MSTKTLGILAVVGIGGYLLYRWQKTKVVAAAAPPTTYQERLAGKYQVPIETVVRLIEAIPEGGVLSPPPEVIAEKILAQR